MEIVAAFACSHSGLIISRRDLAPPAQRETVFGAFARMGEAIRAAKPDAIVLIATDHGRIYPLSGVPQFTIGVNASTRSVGDAELPISDVAIHQPFAQAILSGALAEGIDLAYSEAMAIDHSFLTPLLLALPALDLPIVPIMQNCNAPPLPALRRSHEVGRKLGAAIRKGPPGRVAIIGTGGLSHWVGSPEFQGFLREAPGTRLARQKDYPLRLTDTGTVNAEFDHRFLDLICRGRSAEFLDGWNEERIYAEAGNGGQEVRNWLLAAGIVENAPAEMLGYAPVAEWLTGTGLVRFHV